MNVKLLSMTQNPLETMAYAASRCYMSEPRVEIVKHCWESGHCSIAEHAYFTFEITGVSRSLLAQLTRHRLASYSVTSQRYVDMKDYDMIIPHKIDNNPAAKEIFNKAIDATRDCYKELQELDIKNEDARAVLPNACSTNLVMTINLRSLSNFMNERLCCFDEQTEVLTNNGWKKFKDCTQNDEFYTLNIETDEMELTRAKKFISYPVDEELIHLKGQSIDHFSTYDHNMVVSKSYAKNGEKKWEIMPAQEAMNCKHLSVKKNCKPIKGATPKTFTIPQTFTLQHNQYTEWEKPPQYRC